MFDEFKLDMIDTGEAVIRVRYGGSGPPLLLLHGHPQTHVMWYKVGPRLAQDFTNENRLTSGRLPPPAGCGTSKTINCRCLTKSNNPAKYFVL